jgi:type II secretory pathway component PulF
MLTLLTPLLTVAIAGVVGAFIFSVVAALLDMNEMVLR